VVVELTLERLPISVFISRFQRFLIRQILSWGDAPGYYIPRLWRFRKIMSPFHPMPNLLALRMVGTSQNND
jgi:hypothetical protein